MEFNKLLDQYNLSVKNDSNEDIHRLLFSLLNEYPEKTTEHICIEEICSIYAITKILPKIKKDFTLSIALIVKNEEKFIQNCLFSLKPISDEIIIVDTGSEDNTIDIANKFDCSISEYKWNNNYSEARNFSISKCKSDWILIIDADETISYKDLLKLKQTINTNSNTNAYYLNLKVYTNDASGIDFKPNLNKNCFEAKNYSGWLGGITLKLFKNNPEYKFINPVHESIEESILDQNHKIESINITVHNFGLEKGKDLKNQKKYLEILKRTNEKENLSNKLKLYMAQLLMNLEKNYDYAEKILKSIIQTRTDLDEAKKLLAIINYYKKDHRKFVALLNSVDKKYISKNLLYMYGRAAIETRNLKLANDIWDQYLNQFPNEPGSMYQYAFLKFVEGDLNLCKTILKEILIIDPDNKSAKRRLEIIKAKL